MPNRDRTGPEGFGPKTGRGKGFCVGYEKSVYGDGKGFKRNFHRRRELSEKDEKKILEMKKNWIEQRLKELKK